MLRRLVFAFCLSLVVVISGEAGARLPAVMESEEVVVCPVSDAEAGPPDFAASNCTTMSIWDVDPQNAFIWVKGKITLDEAPGSNGEPLALFVRGKMSSEFYLNGRYVGANGKPGPNKEAETPGRMDAEIFPPQPLFRVGDNEVVFRASAHRGFFRLGNPIHEISIGRSGDITDSILRDYWPSLLTFGLFLAGAIYFAIIGADGAGRKRALTFSAICAFAAAQLIAEVSRGLIAYTYPYHDLRLMLITTFSAGFGLSVAYHVFSTFGIERINTVGAGLAALCLVAIVLVPGFDAKAAVAIAIPLLASLTVSGVWSFRRRPRGFPYFLSLLLFLAANFFYPSIFLDIVFFYLVAALLLFLFVEQGLTLVREAGQRRIEQARADRLELALEQAREREEASTISVINAGKMERISTDRIAHCRGAGGYCEVVLESGREILHAATLAEMEECLPVTFLRVHRSHLVNTAFVKFLNRDPAGTGTLILSNDSRVPVSRRIMPKVRAALRS